jgi:hypothetical protein
MSGAGGYPPALSLTASLSLRTALPFGGEAIPNLDQGGDCHPDDFTASTRGGLSARTPPRGLVAGVVGLVGLVGVMALRRLQTAFASNEH